MIRATKRALEWLALLIAGASAAFLISHCLHTQPKAEVFRGNWEMKEPTPEQRLLELELEYQQLMETMHDKEHP